MIDNLIIAVLFVGVSAFIGFIVGYKKLDIKFLEYWEKRK